ncbi:DUF5995 family protein [Allostreptomyces psammosilenae]|uniref:Uncharacterized protein n=1 Tax=Allostreptomyces psammosilenae TaxID=1892865 RepID=A0A853A1F0_9ACTN|nr:DUF5995 family protein [Allostreptomyces psammosilenae]NYI04228.1 hypothetical protein [Allostreptomyces psammosilenae]
MTTQAPITSTGRSGPGGPDAADAADGPRLAAVVARLAALQEALPAGDGVRHFNGVYLRVTEEIDAALAAGHFADPARTGRLAAVFAERYLVAVDVAARGREPEACWRPLFETRGHGGVHAVQFAVAGMNAHIEHDLPLSVLDVCRADGVPPEAVREDFLAVNAVLARVEAECRELLLPGPDALDLAGPLAHLVNSWSVSRARDAAWATALTLDALGDGPRGLVELATAALSRTVGLVSRQLLTPVGAVAAALDG